MTKSKNTIPPPNKKSKVFASRPPAAPQHSTMVPLKAPALQTTIKAPTIAATTQNSSTLDTTAKLEAAIDATDTLTTAIDSLTGLHYHRNLTGFQKILRSIKHFVESPKESLSKTADSYTHDELFEHAINFVLSHEGGYVNNPKDPGGVTKFGISKRSYPHVDVPNLTVEQAKVIYKRDFWDPYPYKNIYDVEIATKIFDISVNMGTAQGARIVRSALKSIGNNIEKGDVLDSNALACINKSDPSILLAAIKSQTAAHYIAIVAAKPQEKVFLKGWLKRAYA